MSKLGTLALVCLMALSACGEDTANQSSASSERAATPAEIAIPIDQEAAMAATDPENALVIQLESGNVIVQLDPGLAPRHVARMKELARDGFYDGIVFHRVIDGFMAQTGDPTGTGTGGSGKNLDAEFSDASFDRGTLGMARSSSPNSADSQFFICLAAAPHLNGQYTVLGKVVDGMDLVDGIKKGASGSGQVSDPDKMVSVKVLADTR